MTNSVASHEEGDPPAFSVTPEEIRGLVRLVEDNGLSELFYESGDVKIVLRTAAFRPAPTLSPVVSPLGLPSPSPSEEMDFEDEEVTSEPVVDESRLHRIDAPIMGVFYRAATQDAPPFVEVGDQVDEGQVIGLIEAMKVFSEVPSPVTGRIIEIPAKNGALVQPGDTLILLETE